MHACRAIIGLLAAMAVLSGAAHAGDWKSFVHACRIAKETPNRFNIEDCVVRLLGLEPFRPVFQNISPGSGPGFGLGVRSHLYSDRLEKDFRGNVVASTRGFTYLEGRFTLFFPGIGQWNPATATINDKVSLSFFAGRMDLRRQEFYGLGPDTGRNNRALYRHVQDAFGMETNYPLTKWLVTGGKIQALRPRITSSSDKTFVGIDSAYSEPSAPGILKQPLFVNYEAYLRLRTPSAPPFKYDLAARYAIYQDLDSGRYSFRRLTVVARSDFNLSRTMGGNAIERSGLKNTLCAPVRNTSRCSLVDLSISARLSLADLGAANAVPFYLQETLGGMDLNGRDTLRGFADYRFRGPNLMLYQVEARHVVWGLLGVMAFCDLGKVAMQRSDLGFSHLRHDFGVGLFISAANMPVLRVYIAFGGEAARPNAKLANAF